MFRQGQLAVHGLAILLGRNEAGISNRGKIFLHHAVLYQQGLAKEWTLDWTTVHATFSRTLQYHEYS